MTYSTKRFTSKKRDLQALQKFLEELSWVLSSHSNLDFKGLASFAVESSLGNKLISHAPKNPNIHFLVGALPSAFSDIKVFPSNMDIAEFASETLDIPPISRWEKRSRYELIGFIVCETLKLNDIKLEKLVSALSKIISSDSAQKLMRERKKKHLTWNEVIQMLNSERENEERLP